MTSAARLTRITAWGAAAGFACGTATSFPHSMVAVPQTRSAALSIALFGETAKREIFSRLFVQFASRRRNSVGKAVENFAVSTYGDAKMRLIFGASLLDSDKLWRSRRAAPRSLEVPSRTKSSSARPRVFCRGRDEG